MNKANRKELADALAKLSDVKAALEAAHEVAERLAEDEQEKFDNLSEGLQASEKGQAYEEAANTLNDIASDLQAALDGLESAEGHDIP